MPNEITRYRRSAGAITAAGAALAAYNRNPAAFNQAASQAGQLINSGVRNLARRLNSSNNPMKTVEQAAPAAFGHRLTKGEPNIRQSRGSGMPKMVTISNKEVISLGIQGSSSWTSQLEFDLNPGLSSTFPWLSNVAEQYQEYKFVKLIFHYVPIAPTSTQGDVILTPFYDAAAAYPQSEVQASDSINAVIGSVWMDHKCTLSSSLMHPSGVKKYIRTFRMSGDSKSYDVGRLQVSTVNETTTTGIGKLYVDYTVQLFGPRLSPLITTPTSCSVWTLTTSQSFTGSAIQLITNTFGNLTGSSDPLGVTYSAGTFSLPDGNYAVDFFCTVSDSTSEAMTVTPFIFDNQQSRYWYGTQVDRVSGTQNVGSYVRGQVWSIFNGNSTPATVTPSFVLGASFSGTGGSFTQVTSSGVLYGCYVVIYLL
jgi:hypothetical protein